MRCKQLGKSALQVSEICLGTVVFAAQNGEAGGHVPLEENIAACALPLAPEALAAIDAIQLRYTAPAP